VVEPFRVAVKENQTDQPRVRVTIDLRMWYSLGITAVKLEDDEICLVR
jgi:hypothetical protein